MTLLDSKQPKLKVLIRTLRQEKMIVTRSYYFLPQNKDHFLRNLNLAYLLHLCTNVVKVNKTTQVITIRRYKTNIDSNQLKYS